MRIQVTGIGREAEVINHGFEIYSDFGNFYSAKLCGSAVKSDGVAGWNLVHLDNANQYTELPLGLYTTIGLLANCITNVFILLNLCLTAMFFTELYSSETRKLVERLIYYVVYKGTFLPLIVPPTVYHAGLWSTWLAVLCSLKMFQALARDRLERLNASPSATPWTYLRVYSALLFVFLVDAFWIRLCLAIYTTNRSSLFLLLFFEPFSIAFETLQAILVHGFQLVDIWSNNSDCRRPKLFDKLTAGSLLEWKGILIRNLGFFLDMATFFMALGHYLYIWRLHGMAFHLVDAVLFLNIRALLSAILNRVKGFIKLRIALGALNAALPDATTEELRAYDDECAICREPMAKAKKLNCNHLFHLACLRSWLDQGLTDIATAVAEEVAKGPTTKLVVGASSHGIFTSKQKGLSAKASICTLRFYTVYAVSKRKLSIRPSDIHILMNALCTTTLAKPVFPPTAHQSSLPFLGQTLDRLHHSLICIPLTYQHRNFDLFRV